MISRSEAIKQRKAEEAQKQKESRVSRREKPNRALINIKKIRLSKKIVDSEQLKALKEQYKELMEQVPEATIEKEAAESFFNNAESDYIDMAIANKEAADQKYITLIKQLKSLKDQIDSFGYQQAI